jgi:hypothetical protein
MGVEVTRSYRVRPIVHRDDEGEIDVNRSQKMVAGGCLAAFGMLALVPGTAGAVVGGTNATESYSWVAQLTTDQGWHLIDGRLKKLSGTCTGSLIASTWVLTAAHCVTVDKLDEHGRVIEDPDAPLLDPGKITARIGSTTRDSGGEVPSVKRLVTEPGGADIALIELAEPVTATPVKLADSVPGAISRTLTLGPERPGPEVRVLGWGKTCRADDCPKEDTLQQLDTRLGMGLGCLGDDRAICTATTRAAGPDHGDSGGPLVARTGDHWEQYGVTQSITGEKTAKQDSDPMIGEYADVSAYRKWIDDTTSSAGDAAVNATDDPTGDTQDQTSADPTGEAGQVCHNEQFGDVWAEVCVG